MSIAAMIALGLLSGLFLAAGAFALVLRIRAKRPIWKEDDDLLRLRLWFLSR
jgi:hypothetical protein